MPKEDPYVNRAQLLKAIKRYPEIWDSNNKLHLCRSVTAPMWNEIAEQFGGHVPTVKLQSIWSQMKYHYHNLVHRQILHRDRFSTKWEHFEPMSFMYNITVAKIVGASGNSADANATPATSANNTAVSPQLHVPPPQGRGRPSGTYNWFPAPVAVHTDMAGSSAHEVSSFGGSFGSTVPPAAFTVEATTTPMNKFPRAAMLNNTMRTRIIDLIRGYPLLWTGRSREVKNAQNRTSAIWKQVADELGLTPSLVQTRWSIIKQRYVDELQKERRARYACQPFHSTWEHFERMSFMRDILEKKVDEREQTRIYIQEIVSEQQQLMQTMRYVKRDPHEDDQSRASPAISPGMPDGPLPLTVPVTMSSMHLPMTMTMPAGMSVPMMMPMSGPPGHLVVCEDGSVGGTNAAGDMTGVVGIMPMHALGRMRVKSEHDLEWDPFEMILHVQGSGANEPSPVANN